MRLGYVISSIDHWFYRVVYKRDAWDEMVEDWQKSVDDTRLAILVWIISLAVWASRMVLKCLMLTGHVACCFLSRQMEYHADLCAMEVAGSEAVESLLVRLRELSLLDQMALASLANIWKQRHQLPESLPDFYAQLEQRLPSGFHENARTTLINETGSWFATHPTSARRIQEARKRGVPGIFTIEKPARELFKDFGRPAVEVTASHYRQDLRLPVTDPMLKPAVEFFEEPPQAPREKDSYSVMRRLRRSMFDGPKVAGECISQKGVVANHERLPDVSRVMRLRVPMERIRVSLHETYQQKHCIYPQIY